MRRDAEYNVLFATVRDRMQDESDKLDETMTEFQNNTSEGCSEAVPYVSTVPREVPNNHVYHHHQQLLPIF